MKEGIKLTVLLGLELVLFGAIYFICLNILRWEATTSANVIGLLVIGSVVTIVLILSLIER